jgi:hypothetical protein
MPLIVCLLVLVLQMSPILRARLGHLCAGTSDRRSTIRFAGAMRRPIQFETSLCPGNGCSVETSVNVLCYLVVWKLDKTIT